MRWLPHDPTLSRNPIAGLTLATLNIELQEVSELENISSRDNTGTNLSGRQAV